MRTASAIASDGRESISILEPRASITIRANGGGVFTSAEMDDPVTETFVYGTVIDSEGGSGGQTFGTAAEICRLAAAQMALPLPTCGA